MRRDTCTWLTPMDAAISDWARPQTNRSRTTSRSRGRRQGRQQRLEDGAGLGGLEARLDHGESGVGVGGGVVWVGRVERCAASQRVHLQGLGHGLGIEAGALSDLVHHGSVVVAAGGCFDVLRAGHVQLLEHARRLGDHLVVCLNGDRSVPRLKGAGRPLNPAADREAVLRSLACVDDVFVFDDDTPVAALERLRPHLFVKGADYQGADLPEHDVLARWGGHVVIVPLVAGRSTTGLIATAASAGG